MTTAEADELGHASVVVAAFEDAAAIIDRSKSFRSWRRRSSPSTLKQNAFKHFLEAAGNEIQLAHNDGIAKHGMPFERGDEISRETLLSIAIDMHVSILRILEIACEAEKDTRLLDHMHDIADSNRHVAVKTLTDLADRLAAPDRRSSSRFSNSHQRLTARHIRNTLSTDQLKQPAYAPNLAKLKAVPYSPEETRPTSIGHPSITSGPAELEDRGSPVVAGGAGGLASDSHERVHMAISPRRDRPTVLPYRWLRSVFCLGNSPRQIVQPTEKTKSYQPRPSTSTQHQSNVQQPPEVYMPTAPLAEMPAEVTSSDPYTIPALAELDDGKSSINNDKSCDTPLFSDGTPKSAILQSPDSGTYAAGPTRLFLDDSLQSHRRQDRSTDKEAVFCPGAALAQQEPSGGRKLCLVSCGEGQTLHWTCTSCSFCSPALECVEAETAGPDNLADLVATCPLSSEITIHRGVGYRWRFLLCSHLRAAEDEVRTAYGCVFCAAGARDEAGAEDQRLEVYGSVDELLGHVNAVHAGRLSEDVERATRCVDGRIADDGDLGWDVNVCLFE